MIDNFIWFEYFVDHNIKKLIFLQVNVCLECINTSLKTLKRRFIRCSAQATITHLKKFIAKKVLNGMEKYRDVSKKKIYIGIKIIDCLIDWLVILIKFL